MVGYYEYDFPNSYHTLGAGWLSLDGQTWIPATPAPREYNTNMQLGADGHTLEYLADVDGQVMYVRARVGESETTPLGAFWSDDTYTYIMGKTEDHLFVASIPSFPDQCGASLVRFDLETDEALPIDLTPPPGWWMVCSLYNGIGFVDSQGDVYFELNNGAGSQMWVYDIDADAWEPVGEPFGDGGPWSTAWLRQLSKDIFQVTPVVPGSYAYVLRRNPPVWLKVDGWPAFRIDQQQRCAATHIGGSLDEIGYVVLTLDGSDEVAYLYDEHGDRWPWLWLD